MATAKSNWNPGKYQVPPDEKLVLHYGPETDVLALGNGTPASNGWSVAEGLVVFCDEEDTPQDGNAGGSSRRIAPTTVAGRWAPLTTLFTDSGKQQKALCSKHKAFCIDPVRCDDERVPVRGRIRQASARGEKWNTQRSVPLRRPVVHRH